MQQAGQPALRLPQLDALEHPDIERKLDRGREDTTAIGMDAESEDAADGRRKINGREELFRARLHAHCVELPLRIVAVDVFARRVMENAVEPAAVFREA